jgi:hypothetical protein
MTMLAGSSIARFGRGPKREAIWNQLEEHRTDRPALAELQHAGEVEWFTLTKRSRQAPARGETLRHGHKTPKG